MRLVETDTEGPRDAGEEEAATPPRPERRRVSRSLVLTFLVLVAIVVAVYLLFPERHNALMTTVMEAHRSDLEFELVEPSPGELAAWGLAVLGKNVPWPKPEPDVQILGAKSMKVLKRRAALVRYRVGGDPVSLLVQRPRDAVPRKHRRREGDDLCMSWRAKKKWTFTAVGPAASVNRWGRYLGAPKKYLSQADSDE